jgi:hypothetical protein
MRCNMLHSEIGAQVRAQSFDRLFHRGGADPSMCPVRPFHICLIATVSQKMILHARQSPGQSSMTPCDADSDVPRSVKELLPRALAFDPTPAGLLNGRTFRERCKREWKKLRERRFATGSPVCEICGEDQRASRLLDGHEIYSYPNRRTIRLERVCFICKLCHRAIHLERLRRFASIDYVVAVERHY